VDRGFFCFAFTDHGSQERKLNFWCFNPGLAMQELTKMVKHVILTSGTLSPLDSYASELSLTFPVRLENPHVISDWQVFFFFLGAGEHGR
jgi:regulator of telomere elongation helicase 1